MTSIEELAGQAADLMASQQAMPDEGALEELRSIVRAGHVTAVWLTQKSSAGPAEVLGVFSSPGRARQACQDSANEYFGAARTKPLKWQGNHVVAGQADRWSASHHHPGSGMQLFQLTRYEIDQET